MVQSVLFLAGLLTDLMRKGVVDAAVLVREARDDWLSDPLWFVVRPEDRYRSRLVIRKQSAGVISVGFIVFGLGSRRVSLEIRRPFPDQVRTQSRPTV